MAQFMLLPASESSITLSVNASFISIDLLPSIGGTFAKSGNAIISVSTDNYSGYSLSIKMNNSTSLLGSDEDKIDSISQSITESTFQTDSNYINEWGYKPN